MTYADYLESVLRRIPHPGPDCPDNGCELCRSDEEFDGDLPPGKAENKDSAPLSVKENET